MSKINLHHIDCMEYMASLPDKAFDLAIVDPPYGIGWDGEKAGMAENSSAKWKAPPTANRYVKKEWDKGAPPMEYFDELRRVSREQIIWGGNYFPLPPTGGWVVWKKGTAEGMSLSDAELAWTNASNNVKVVELLWAGFRRCEAADRIHPTQKPVALYRWLLQNYAKPGDNILDTHGGSMSIAIACDIEGFDLDLCELDKDYFEAGKKRLEQHQSQPRMFAPEPIPVNVQTSIEDAE